MSDIKLFHYGPQGVSELEGKAAVVEKQLQQLIENHMESFLGIRFLASEYNTGKTHKGRIDSLGLDENGCPVIIEYKRYSNENVINQGLFYLDWLLDHQAEFQLLVMKKLGSVVSESIEWEGTRLLCIAGDFTKYDEHAVQQINRNIELLRYKLFAEDLLMLELVNVVAASSQFVKYQASEQNAQTRVDKQKGVYGMKTHLEQLELAPPMLRLLYEGVVDFTSSLGDDVLYKQLKLYGAFRRLKNFVSVIVLPKQDPKLQLLLKLDPKTVDIEEGFSRDVSDIGHWGTGDLELTLRVVDDLEKAKPFIMKAFEEN
jgi:predicted transport protein